MKNILTFFLICLLTAKLSFTSAQNLVPNGSFETKDPSLGCPIPDSFDSGKPQFWDGLIDTQNGGGDISGDYFNPCAPAGHNYPGANYNGCELPRDGQSYCGFLAASRNLAAPAKCSEYIVNNHIVLTGGQRYYVEFYVSDAETQSQGSTAFSRRIGALFTQDISRIFSGQTNGLNTLVPQIPNTFPASDFYQRIDGWDKISGYFTPSGSGQQNWSIVIGNFDPGMNVITHPNPDIPSYSEANPELLPKKNLTSSYVGAYYFVDAVTIIPDGQTAPNYDPYVTPTQGVCSSTPTTYNLQNALFGARVSWSVSPTNLFSGATSGTGSSANLTGISGASGAATLTYSMASDCGPYPAPSVPIWVGTPLLGLALDGHALPSDNFLHVATGQHTLSIFNYGSTNVSMDVTRVIGGLLPGTTTPYPNMGNGAEIDYSWFIVHVGETYFFTVSNSSACGTRSTGAEITTDNNIQDIVIAYPNPATSALTVQLSGSPSTNEDESGHEPYQVDLMDKFSQIVYSTQSSKRKIDIPLDGIPNGLYYLNVHYQGEVLRQQIVIGK